MRHKTYNINKRQTPCARKVSAKETAKITMTEERKVGVRHSFNTD